MILGFIPVLVVIRVYILGFGVQRSNLGFLSVMTCHRAATSFCQTKPSWFSSGWTLPGTHSTRRRRLTRAVVLPRVKMAACASVQAHAFAPVRTARRNVSVKSSGSAFLGASLAAPVRSVRVGAAAAAGALKVQARYDAGVGVFGNKAGMTQLFTDDG